MSDDTTRTKTLWSETQIELLYAALEKNHSDEAVLEIARDLASRGFPGEYLVDKVQKQLGMMSAGRLRGLVKKL